MPLTKQQTDQLEALVDATHPAAVVNALADICHAKAEHLRSNWQDRTAAAVWDRRGVALGKVAYRLTFERP